MFELQQRDRETSALAWTLFLIVLIGAAGGGWFLVNNLHQREKQLSEANDALKVQKGRMDIEHAGATRCTQDLAACKTDLGTCNTNLSAAQARVEELQKRRR